MRQTDELKALHRECRGTQDESLRVRIHRSLSWLARADKESSDPDAQFIFLWIALNSAYASDLGFELSEREQASKFIQSLIALDREERLHATLFRQFSGPIRTLIENQFVYEPFWRALREHDSSGSWEERFSNSKRAALHALMEKRTEVVLGIVLDRLYTLRNQLVHGGATWNGSANRAQIRDGVAILQTIVPIIVAIMMRQTDDSFGPVAYPYLSA